MKSRFILSVAEMLAIQQDMNRYISAPLIAGNQASSRPNGGRPTFKANRRKQIKQNARR